MQLKNFQSILELKIIKKLVIVSLIRNLWTVANKSEAKLLALNELLISMLIAFISSELAIKLENFLKNYLIIN